MDICVKNFHNGEIGLDKNGYCNTMKEVIVLKVNEEDAAVIPKPKFRCEFCKKERNYTEEEARKHTIACKRYHETLDKFKAKSN
jgi:hypothetical protein